MELMLPFIGLIITCFACATFTGKWLAKRKKHPVLIGLGAVFAFFVPYALAYFAVSALLALGIGADNDVGFLEDTRRSYAALR